MPSYVNANINLELWGELFHFAFGWECSHKKEAH